MSRCLYLKRQAFTLVELLTVMAIIGVLAGLLLPAINGAREAARKNTCLSNIVQIARAVRTYESTYKVLPPAGKGVDKEAFAAFMGGANTNFVRAGRYLTGSDNAPMSSRRLETSPSVFLALLPYLDSSNLYDQYNFSYEYMDKRVSKVRATDKVQDFVDSREMNPDAVRFGNIGTATQHLSFLRCPSNPNGSLKDPYKYGSTDYAATVYTDIYPGNEYTKATGDLKRAARVRRSTQEGILGLKTLPSSKVKDGESTTIVFIEDAGRADGVLGWNTLALHQFESPTCSVVDQNDNVLVGYGCAAASDNGALVHYSVHRWADSNAAGIGISGQDVDQDEQVPNGFVNNSNERLGGTIPYLWSRHNCGPNQEAYSFHKGGVLTATFDGSGHFMSDSIDPVTLRFLITRDEGHRPPTDPFQ